MSSNQIKLNSVQQSFIHGTGVKLQHSATKLDHIAEICVYIYIYTHPTRIRVVGFVSESFNQNES